MRHEIVLWLVDRPALAQCLEVGAEKIIVESIRMIPVELSTLVERERGEVLVVGIHVNERHRAGCQQLGDVSCHGRFARSGAPGNSDYQGFEHPAAKLRWRCLERIMPALEAT